MCKYTLYRCERCIYYVEVIYIHIYIYTVCEGCLSNRVIIYYSETYSHTHSALHDARHKLLADVFYGTPPSASMIESMQQQNFELEALEMRGYVVMIVMFE